MDGDRKVPGDGRSVHTVENAHVALDGGARTREQTVVARPADLAAPGVVRAGGKPAAPPFPGSVRGLDGGVAASRSGRPEVIDLYRRFAVLRERLVDYPVEQARSSVAADRPLMRPLFLDWPRDTMIWQYPMQYLLGDDLLVAPVVEPGADRWDVYLPDGEWVDAWAGSSLPGGQVVTVSAPLDRIPVFVRAAVAERHLPRFQALPA